MTEVFIAGRMGQILGKTHTFNCSTLKEVFAAIECNTGKLRKYMCFNKKRLFAIFVNGKKVESDFLGEYKVKNSTVHILPLLMGAVGMTAAMAFGIGTTTTAAGATVAGTGTYIAAGIINAAVSFGMSMLIAKIMAPDDPKAKSSTSFVFGSPENVTEQGEPVPVGYGRLIVAGKVISVSSFNIDRQVFQDPDFYNTISNSNINLSAQETFSTEQGSSAVSP